MEFLFKTALHIHVLFHALYCCHQYHSIFIGYKYCIKNDARAKWYVCTEHGKAAQLLCKTKEFYASGQHECECVLVERSVERQMSVCVHNRSWAELNSYQFPSIVDIPAKQASCHRTNVLASLSDVVEDNSGCGGKAERPPSHSRAIFNAILWHEAHNDT